MRKISLILILNMMIISHLLADKGIINIKTWEYIDIFINNKYKGVAGEGITKIKLNEGTYLIKVSGNSQDGEWHYETERKIFIGADMEITTTLIPNKYPSKKRKDRQKQFDTKLLKETNKFGCKSIKEYNQYIKINKDIQKLKLELENINKIKKKIVKKNGYMVSNKYIDLVGVQFNLNNKKNLIINIKNKTKDTITYFWSYFHFANENLEYLGSFKKYKEYIKIAPHKTKKFTINISNSLYRKLIKSKDIKLFMNVDSIRYKDNIGKAYGKIKKYTRLEQDINKISKQNIINIKNKLQEKNILNKQVCK